MSDAFAEGATSPSTSENILCRRRPFSTEEKEQRDRRAAERIQKRGSKSGLAESALAPVDLEEDDEGHDGTDDATSVASDASSKARTPDKRIKDGRAVVVGKDSNILKRRHTAQNATVETKKETIRHSTAPSLVLDNSADDTGGKTLWRHPFNGAEFPLKNDATAETKTEALLSENERLKRSVEELEKRIQLKETSRLITYNRMRDKSAKERRTSKEFEDFKKTFASTSRVSFIKITKLHNTPPLIKALHERLYDKKVFDSMLAKDPVGIYKGLSFKGAPLVSLFSKPSSDLTLWDENVDFFLEI